MRLKPLLGQGKGGSRCDQPLYGWIVGQGEKKGYVLQYPGALEAVDEEAGHVVLDPHGGEDHGEAGGFPADLGLPGDLVTLFAAGFDVFRLNFRDHGDTHHLNPGLFHSCRLEEVVHALADLQDRLQARRWCLAGFSLGGNFSLRVWLLVTGAGSLLVIRVFRLLRLFRILKLSRYVGAGDILVEALVNSRRKIIVFLYSVLTIVIICGALMYIIEGPENGFTSIPRGVYWAIVTLTTVGYGDIAPQTILGKLLASVVMILGYGIIAVPTGIVTVELAHRRLGEVSTQSCPECSGEGHDRDARHCKHCGAHL